MKPSEMKTEELLNEQANVRLVLVPMADDQLWHPNTELTERVFRKYLELASRLEAARQLMRDVVNSTYPPTKHTPPSGSKRMASIQVSVDRMEEWLER